MFGMEAVLGRKDEQRRRWVSYPIDCRTFRYIQVGWASKSHPTFCRSRVGEKPHPIIVVYLVTSVDLMKPLFATKKVLSIVFRKFVSDKMKSRAGTRRWSGYAPLDCLRASVGGGVKGGEAVHLDS